MRPVILTSAIFGLAFYLLSISVSVASFPTANGETNVSVSFEFPGGTTNIISLTYDSALDAFKKKPLPEDVAPTPYKIDLWVYAALQALNLPFKTKTVRGDTAIEQVAKTSNGPDGEWIYYVNGMRSRYHINTQLDERVKTIRFVFKPKMSPMKAQLASPK
jgi:hypothetical protein